MSDIKDNTSLQQGVVVETALPFSFYDAITGETEDNFTNHNQLAFDIVDVFSHADNSEIRDKTNQYKVLEHKLNTILHLLRFLLASQRDVASQYQIRLSALMVEWDNAQFTEKEIKSIKESQKLVFDFYPSNELPWPIKRLGQVIEVNGSMITAQFLPVEPVDDERFAKWVFQLHRRNIHKQKG